MLLQSEACCRSLNSISIGCVLILYELQQPAQQVKNQLFILVLYNRVEWFCTFCDTFLQITYSFRSSIPKNRQLRLHARPKFNFQINTGTLKTNIFWENLQKPFFIHQSTCNHQKENYKLNFKKKFLLLPKMGKLVFDLNQMFFSFLLFLSLKKSKNTFPPVASFKNVKQFLVVVAVYRETVKIILGPGKS